MTVEKARIIRLAVKILFMVLVFMALVFVPAGTLKWTAAWIFFTFYLVRVSGVIMWWRRKFPALLLIYLAVPGLDAVRFGWSMVPTATKVACFIGIIAALDLLLWAAKENAYLSQVVRTALEDRALMRELAGCTECAARVRYRFLPGIW